jgi:hypothetical protein
MTHREISKLGTPNTSVYRKNSHSKKKSTKSFIPESILSLSTAIEMQKTLLRSALADGTFLQLGLCEAKNRPTYFLAN